jgi:hypothetical protein
LHLVEATFADTQSGRVTLRPVGTRDETLAQLERAETGRIV